MRSNIARTCGSASVPDSGRGVSAGSAIRRRLPVKRLRAPDAARRSPVCEQMWRPTGRHIAPYWRSERNETTSWNFFGELFAKAANDGIGAVGFLIVEAIAPGRR